MEDLLRQHTFASHAAVATGSVALASFLTYPLDTLKSLHQVAAGSQKQLNFTQVLSRIRAVSGFPGFYNGISWLTVGRISGLGLRFGTYELLSAFYKDGREDNYVYVSEALLAGIAAGALEAFAASPFELFRLRQQLSSAASYQNMCTTEVVRDMNPMISRLGRGYIPDMKSLRHTVDMLSVLSPTNPNMTMALKEYPWMMTGTGRPPLASDIRSPSHIISLEGWSSLWRGLRSALARDCIFGGVFFSTWQFYHIAMLEWKALDIDPPPKSIADVEPVSPLAASFAAGLCGSIAAAASHCFDTAQTRSQCTVVPKYISMERKFLKWKVPGTGIERLTGISPADRSFLLRGIWLRMARSGISSFAVVGSYFFAVDYLL